MKKLHQLINHYINQCPWLPWCGPPGSLRVERAVERSCWVGDLQPYGSGDPGLAGETGSEPAVHRYI